MAKGSVEIEISVGHNCDELASPLPHIAPDPAHPHCEFAQGAPGVGIGERIYIDKGVTPSPHDIGLFDPGEHG